MPRKAPTPVAIAIPAGSRGQQCKYGCGTTIWWGKHPKTGKPTPVSCNGALLSDARPPTDRTAGAGVSHFTDCEKYHELRRAKTPRGGQINVPDEPIAGTFVLSPDGGPH